MEKSKLKGMVFAALFAALTGAVAWFKLPLPFTPVPITLQTMLVLMSGAMLGPAYGSLAMIIYLVLGAIGLPVFAGGSSGLGVLVGPTGGYLFSYPFAAFLTGIIIKEKKLGKFLKYFSYTVILALISIVSLDSIFNVGIMKLWDDSSKSYVPMVSLISGNQRVMLIVISLFVLVLFLVLAFYLKKSKSFSIDVILAMFSGTLIIYVIGSVQGKFVTGLPWSAILVGWVLPFIIGDTLKLLAAAWILNKVDIKRYMK